MLWLTLDPEDMAIFSMPLMPHHYEGTNETMGVTSLTHVVELSICSIFKYS